MSIPTRDRTAGPATPRTASAPDPHRTATCLGRGTGVGHGLRGWAICVAPLLWIACGRGGERVAAPAIERPAALVGGRAVPREWVVAAVQSEGLDVAHALQRAVETAALGQLARRRGWERSAALAGERRSVLVRMLLTRQAEITDPPSPRDRADMEQAYREHLAWFVHPELRTVEHLAIVLDPGGGRGGGRTEPPPAEAWDEARQVLESVLPLARDASSTDAFAALQATLDRRWKERWQATGRDDKHVPPVRAERIGPIDADGAGYDPAFVAAAFALRGVGAVSEPVRTAFGWHVLYLHEVQPPRQTAFDQAIPEILDKARTAIESRRAAGLVGQTATRLGVQTHPERLSLTSRGGGAGAAP